MTFRWLRIRNWEKWQSYRSDRGQPPWIKVHREVMRNPQWVALSDAQRGQLLAMWILAADRDGEIPADPAILSRLCYMDSEPDLQTFVALGFIEGDANVTSTRRQHDRPEAEAEAEEETEAEKEGGGGAREDVENSTTTDSELMTLVEYLGELAAYADDLSEYERKAVMGTWGPQGTRTAEVWGDTPEEQRVAILASTIGHYRAERGSRPWHGPMFEDRLRQAVQRAKRPPEGSEAARWDAKTEQAHYASHGTYTRGSTGPAPIRLCRCGTVLGKDGLCPKCNQGAEVPPEQPEPAGREVS